MWLISNTLNSSFLGKFEKKIIVPFFELLIETASIRIKRVSNFQDFKKRVLLKLPYYQGLKDEHKLIIDYIFSIKKDHRYFFKVFLSLLTRHTQSRLKRLYKVYQLQNIMVSNRNYNIKQFEVDDDFRTIFIKFFYDRFFNEDRIWRNIAGENYSKRIFHQKFHEENDEMSVCPYCDMSSPLADSSNYVEHFLPKDKFPFLTMCAMNLVSSCDACNKGADGKGESVISPIVTPYSRQIGNTLKFEADTDFEKISITNPSSEPEIENFLSLLKISKRYNQKKARSHLKTEVKIQFATLHRYAMSSKLNEKDIHDFLSERDKHTPLNLATKSIIKDLFF